VLILHLTLITVELVETDVLRMMSVLAVSVFVVKQAAQQGKYVVVVNVYLSVIRVSVRNVNHPLKAVGLLVLAAKFVMVVNADKRIKNIAKDALVLIQSYQHVLIQDTNVVRVSVVILSVNNVVLIL
jgi:hypothetical protein